MSKLLQSGIDGPVLVVLALLAGCGASGPTENDVVLAQKRLARAAGHDYKEIEVSNLKCNQVGEAWGCSFDARGIELVGGGKEVKFDFKGLNKKLQKRGDVWADTF